MITSQFYLKNLWRWKCGLPEVSEESKIIDLKEMRKSQWSFTFEKLMRNRLIMGALRYGRMNQSGKPQYNVIPSMIKRLHQYEETGNTEFLVDVANLCLLEFEEGHHKKKHFSSIDDGEHVTKVGT